jgi:hypothetical protein
MVAMAIIATLFVFLAFSPKPDLAMQETGLLQSKMQWLRFSAISAAKSNQIYCDDVAFSLYNESGSPCYTHRWKNRVTVSSDFDSNLCGFDMEGKSISQTTKHVVIKDDKKFFRLTISPAGALKIEESIDGVAWQ